MANSKMFAAAPSWLKYRLSSEQFCLWPLEADKELIIGSSTLFPAGIAVIAWLLTGTTTATDAFVIKSQVNLKL